MDISRCLLTYQSWNYMTLQINTSALPKIVPCLFLFPLLLTLCFIFFSNTWHFLQQPKPNGLMMWVRCKGKFLSTCLTLAGTRFWHCTNWNWLRYFLFLNLGRFSSCNIGPQSTLLESSGTITALTLKTKLLYMTYVISTMLPKMGYIRIWRNIRRKWPRWVSPASLLCISHSKNSLTFISCKL